MRGWNTWTWQPKGTTLAAGILVWISFLHLIGIYIFRSGFFLNRLAVPDISLCSDNACTLPATHKRVVLLVIDSLRFDLISPDPPSPRSPFHHDILTLPRELTEKYPARSFIYHAFADPPTSTLQRIKAITTGSLPFFLNVASSFGGSSITGDSFIAQLNRAGKKVAFMGDDTWTAVFPTSFAPNMTFPYHSFDIEDLHSVDDGIIKHLFPLLDDRSRSWDAIIGHFLGVDHVGHRVGPDHPRMKAKLRQMDSVLRRVVKALEDDTLLVVMGDHGMDSKGDHAGYSELETSSAMWIYSKGPMLSSRHPSTIPSELRPTALFPGASVPHRWIQQIDLVPSLSLLLGLPIPFNNLGTIIPELFSRGLGHKGFALESAMRLNARQIKAYLDSYRASGSGGELDGVWESLESARTTATLDEHEKRPDLVAHHIYTRYALSVCRSLWAQFDVLRMGMGLVVLSMSLIATAVLYSHLGKMTDWENWLDNTLRRVVWSTIAGIVLGPMVHSPLSPYLPGINVLQTRLVLVSILSCGTLLTDAFPPLSLSSLVSLPLLLVPHSLAFFSYSLTVWEDRVVLFLLLLSLVPTLLTAIIAPIPRLRYRILYYAAIYAACVRLMGISTVCREEQQHCVVTFYASPTVHSPPSLILIVAVPISLVLPSTIRYFLAISGSDKGIVPVFLSYILRPALFASNVCWIFEWLQSFEIVGSEWAPTLRTARTVLARCTVGGLLVGTSTLWWINPLRPEVQMQEKLKDKGKKYQATLLGHPNAYGSLFVIYWCTFFVLVHVATQLTGQVVLALAMVALLAHLEITDTVREVYAYNAALSVDKPSAVLNLEKLKTSMAPFTFSHISTFALLAVHTFHGTGHQAIFSALQWKASFILTPTFELPVSLILVALNTFGAFFLLALAAPLLACWQLAPPAHIKGALRAGLGMMLYFTALLVGSAAGAAWLRSHPMLWKVFAPRFMEAIYSLLAVDVAVLVGVGIGVATVSTRAERCFERMG